MITDSGVVLLLIIPVVTVILVVFALHAVDFMVWLGQSIWSAFRG